MRIDLRFLFTPRNPASVGGRQRKSRNRVTPCIPAQQAICTFLPPHMVTLGAACFANWTQPVAASRGTLASSPIQAVKMDSYAPCPVLCTFASSATAPVLVPNPDVG